MSWIKPTTQDHIDQYEIQIKRLEEKIASIRYHIDNVLKPRLNKEMGQQELEQCP